ncbi:MAG: CBS domain-containing protein [Planctomycetota bacterium]
MLVKDVMTKDLAFCTPQDGCIAAAKLMKAEDVGSIPIVRDANSKKLVGILTDRDICIQVVAEERNALEVTCEAIMATSLVTVKPDDDLERCAELMQENQVRRIPVVDEKGALAGIVAQADVAQEAEDAEVVKETVEQVSKPSRAVKAPKTPKREAA